MVALTTGGTLTISDADAGQASFAPQAATAGSFGTFTLDAAGAWTYALNNAAPAVQALGAGQTLTETFSVAALGWNHFLGHRHDQRQQRCRSAVQWQRSCR